MYDRVYFQLSEFKKGFFEVIPNKVIFDFDEKELQELLCGNISLSVEDWKNNTFYLRCYPDEEDIVWFWEIIEGLSQNERNSLFSAVCGASNPPFGGFSHLDPPFQISRVSSSPELIPSTHTCFNTLDLPKYHSKETLETKLKLLIEHNQGFGNG